MGHSAVENFDLSEPYSALLLRFRYEHVRRLSLQGEFVSRSMPMLSPLALFAHASAPEQAFEPLLCSPLALNPLCTPVTTSLESINGALSAAESTNAPFFNVYAWLASSPLSRFFAFADKFSARFEGQEFLSLGLNQGGSEDYRGPVNFCKGSSYADLVTSPALSLQPSRGVASLSLAGNRLYLIHRHLTHLQTPTPASLFPHAPSASFPKDMSLYTAFFPLGEVSCLPAQPVVAATNLSSAVHMAPSALANHELQGWGLLGYEDLGLTSGAAAKGLISAGMNAARQHANTAGSCLGLSFSHLSLVQSAGSFFSTDLFSDWAPLWLLSFGVSPETRGAISFFLSASKATPFLLAAQVYFLGTDYLLGRISSLTSSLLIHAQPAWVSSLGLSFLSASLGPVHGPQKSHMQFKDPFVFFLGSFSLELDFDSTDIYSWVSDVEIITFQQQHSPLPSFPRGSLGFNS